MTIPGRSAYLVDASVALKWFLPPEREQDAALARSLVGRVPLRTTGLAILEVGNILVRRSGWGGDRIVPALRLLLVICGEPVDLLPEDHAAAVGLALDHDLTFYDASYVAIANRVGRPLLSADDDLLRPGLAVSLRDVGDSA